MFKLCRKVSLYDETPFLFSSAWYDWVTHREVCFPIGIHLLVRWVRAFWLWTLRANARDALVAKAHATGWACGRQVGVEEGKREAIEEFKKRLQAARDGEWVRVPGEWVRVPDGMSIECAAELQAEAIRERNHE